MPRYLRPCTFAVAALLIGCGGGGKINFSQPDDTPLNTLSTEELKQMCKEALGPTSDVLIEGICSTQGLTALQTGSSCDQVKQQCLANPPSNLLVDPDTVCGNIQTTDGQLANCTATVGQYERCVNDLLDWVDEIFGQISCSSSIEDLIAFTQNVQTTPPASCTEFAAACASLGINFGSTTIFGSGG